MDLTAARAAYDGRQWRRAFEEYDGADHLDADDLDRYAAAAMMLGRMDDYFAIRERAYHQLLAEGDLEGAAMAAGWIGTQRLVQGEIGPGTGWLARARRIGAELDQEGVTLGFDLLSQGLEASFAGDPERAVALAGRAAAVGRRYGNHDLAALATFQQGMTLLRTGAVTDGLACLDEAMVAVAAGEVTPMVTGIVYCGVIAGCWSVYELGRAREWTAAMTSWCDEQSDLGNFTGECKVRRAELAQLRGDWPAALDELAAVSPTDVDAWASGAAAYARGNLARLVGRFESAEEEFALAAQLGSEPQPGLALLRLARGSQQAAAAMVRRALAEVDEIGQRVELLSAATEILVEVGDRDEAVEAANELELIARRHAFPVVEAVAAQARAQVELESGRADAALPLLRTALRIWLSEPAPYLEARVRVLVSRACEALGDHDSARRERDLARSRFEALGAIPDLARLDGKDGVLSARELEVLKLVATGATNRAIAARLVLSERTVDRHVSNILAKLGVSSRSAATAYAHDRQLV